MGKISRTQRYKKQKKRENFIESIFFVAIVKYGNIQALAIIARYMPLTFWSIPGNIYETMNIGSERAIKRMKELPENFLISSICSAPFIHFNSPNIAQR